jgi:membrane protein YqaA with SNARE-associated domain
VKLAPIAFLHKFSAALLMLLKPFGIWGVAGLALIDSALIPIPVSMDGVIIGYVATNHQRFLLYSFVAAAASSIGSLVPFFIGRAGGELFLLKRINRERYERIRDRFERQEFLAIMVPAMLPPPTPLKLFEFAAGVFEMKTLPFLLAIFCGKFTQFMVCSLLTIWFGPTLIPLPTPRRPPTSGPGHRSRSGCSALVALLRDSQSLRPPQGPPAPRRGGSLSAPLAENARTRQRPRTQRGLYSCIRFFRPPSKG